jgi:hypothetical protein
MTVSYPPPNRFISIDGMFIGIQAISHVKILESGNVELFLISEQKPLAFCDNSAKNLLSFLETNSTAIEK